MTENVWMITIVLGLLMVAIVPAEAAEPWASLPWTPAKLATAIPFSFVYDGKHSAELLPAWERTHTVQTAADGKEQQVITYTDPVTGLEVICEATRFTDYPAVEWVLRLRNTGAEDTPILENILPLDTRITTPPGEIILHHAHGSTGEPTDFLPIDETVAPAAELAIAPEPGRSSDGALPFFNLEGSGGGLVGASGWSGQWAMRLHRDAEDELTLQAGQQTTHLKLHPGESIRTPSILLVVWQGEDRMRGHNLLRRLLLAHYVPRLNGEIVLPPTSHNTWSVFRWGNDVTEENQLQTIQAMKGLGLEVFWLDAGWFEGGWPYGVGNCWVPKREAFPRGLRPLGDAAHEQGLRFLVWFEPGRVHPNTRIAREHPQWVTFLEGATPAYPWHRGDGLFHLGDPQAREWMTNLISKCIADWGIDIYRCDFNIDPLRFWQAADAPDRQGISEIRYIEGLYAMWDELLARHPGLVIDNCSSGGRRIDLETISRSLPLWRSDTYGRPNWDQVQTAGLSLYIPLHSSGVRRFDPYSFRSVAQTGVCIMSYVCSESFPREQAIAAIKELKALRPLYLGDYYPLMDINLDQSHWCAWQFDRPELGRGFAMFFRRSQSLYPAVDIHLRGLDAGATYEVTFVDTGHERTMTGAELAELRVEIGSAPASMLVTYQKVGQ